MASEFTPIEQGENFSTSTGTLDREEMSELQSPNLDQHQAIWDRQVDTATSDAISG